MSSSGQATRRMVDLSLVLDVSSSIGVEVAGGERRRADVRVVVRRERRSHCPDHLRQRRQGDRPDARRPAGSTSRRWWPTFRRPCRAAARRWSKGFIAAGTSSARSRAARSRACASSCCSPTVRRTACPASTTRRRSRRASARSTSRRTCRTLTARRGTIRRSTACMTPTPVCRQFCRPSRST